MLPIEADTPACPEGPGVAALLESVEILQRFGGAELRTFARYVTLHNAAVGEYIFREGEHGSDLYFLVSGEVCVRKELDSRQARTVAQEAGRRTIGEMALIDGEPRSASCLVTRPSRLLVLRAQAFERLCKEHPALALHLVRELARVISRRLRLTSGRLIEYLPD